MYLTATSARGVRFQGNGHPKKDAKANYRAANIKSRQCNPLWRGLHGFVLGGFFDATVTVDTTMVSIS